ncbi:MAG: hypothetical protein ACOH2D_18125 [Gelidibacter sp.]
MTEVNFIQHLKAVFLLFAKDNRLNPTHISLYLAFFQIWNHNRFPQRFYVNREEVMRLAKIGSKSTYHRCAKDLNNFEYLLYFPSHNPFKGSEINMLIFGTSSGQALVSSVPFSGQALDLSVPNSGQVVGRLYKHNKTIVNSYKLQKPKNENQVLDFFKKQKWSEMEAAKFFNHYESTGWKLGGKVQIENWQATAKNWMIKAAEIALKTKTNENGSQLSQNRDNLHTTRNKDYNQPL